MRRSRYYTLVGGTVAVVAVVVVLASLAFGIFQRSSDTAKDVGTSVSSVDRTAPGAPGTEALVQKAGPEFGSGPHEGIPVHGQWTIEVREPDGRLVARREFDNAFTGSGNTILLEFLDGVRTPGAWEVHLGNSDTAQTPCVFNLARAMCRVAEPNHSLTGSNIFKNLVVTRPASGADANKFVLEGSATANFAGAINQVATAVQACASTVAPGSCGPANVDFGSTFTFTTLGTAVAVQQFQQINAKVALAFGP